MEASSLSFSQIVLAVYSSTMLRYLLFASVAWLLAYFIFVRRWQHRKIIQRMPTQLDMRRELRWSLCSILIFGAIGSATLWLSTCGWTQVYWSVHSHGWTWFFLSIFLAVCIHDAYFYWTHRLLHHPLFFRRFHVIHHRSTNPSPWASYAFSPMEAVIQASIIPLVACVMPMHPFAIGLFMLWQIIYNVLGHTGYEFHPHALMQSKLKFVLNTPTNHIMHHEHVRGNYGLYFNIWDRIRCIMKSVLWK